MRVVFRSPEAWPREGGGAFALLEARDPARRDALAAAVSEGGLGALRASGPSPETLYAPREPVFDDLLAIWLLTATERPPAPVVEALAEHARLLRQGHRPGRAPLERTPGAVLDQIVRGCADLERESEAEDLLSRTAGLFRHLAERLEAGASLTDEDLLRGATAFQEEEAILEGDRTLYAEDRRRGEVWRGVLGQGGVARPVDLLVLEEPLSTRFADWARRDPEAPSGDGFALLLVRDARGQWVLSADPGRRLAIQPLADALQRAEDARGATPGSERWYAGQRHRGTLVASPRTGTRLDRRAILRALRAPLRLRRPGRLRRPLAWGAAGAAAAAVALVLLGIGRGGGAQPPDEPRGAAAAPLPPDDEPRLRGVRVRDPGTRDLTRVGLYDRVHVFVVGIDRYEDATLDLEYAVRDAHAVRDVLRERFQVDEVHELYDEEATRENVLGALGGLSALGANDALFVFWAGHGTTIHTATGEAMGYLVPHDGSRESASAIVARDVSMEEVRSLMARVVPAKHKFLAVDACYGGILATRDAGSRPSYDARYLRLVTREPVFQVLTAGKADQTVLDSGPGGHSAFAGHLIERLRRAERYLTASELSLDVSRRVFETARDRGHDQVPDFGRVSGSGDFVFLVASTSDEGG